MTMNDTWGFKSYDHNWKSAEQLIRHLIDTSSKGGNLLLNVGPTAEGLIPQPSVERLQAIGAWLKKNGESIYGTTASPFKRLTWGRASQKPDRLYLNVFYWPKDGQLVVPMRSGAKKAYLLGAPCITLRAETEHVETVQHGWNVLVGADTSRIVNAIKTFRPHGARPPIFGDGTAATQIVEILTEAHARRSPVSSGSATGTRTLAGAGV